MRVVTFNVWNTEGDPRRTELINRELRRLDPDLVSLQEVVHIPERDQLSELMDGTGLHGTHRNQVLAETLPGGERYGGCAVATRWPHRVVDALDMCGADAPDVPWATLAASVAIPGAGELLFIATTTAWRLSAEAARERQVLAVTDLDARHRTRLPTIIAGDLNAAPDTTSIRYLTGRGSLAGRSVCYHDAWEVAGDGPGHTWTTENPNAAKGMDQVVRQPGHRRRIDYVLVGSWDAHPDARCRIEGASSAFDKPTDGVWLSDHFGVVVDLDPDRDLSTEG
ncbi:endonuclease/exonuclease/phosphatase family protein [Streptomyces sp. 2A115]